MRVYFSHPWEKREELKKLAARMSELGVTVVNPFFYSAYAQKLTKKFIDMYKREDEIPDEKWDELARLVVNKDLRFIKGSDAMVAVLDGEVKFSAGTFMEIFFAAHDCEIPVYILICNLDKQPRMRFHCWIRKFAAKIFLSEDDLLAAVKELAEVPES